MSGMPHLCRESDIQKEGGQKEGGERPRGRQTRSRSASAPFARRSARPLVPPFAAIGRDVSVVPIQWFDADGWFPSVG